MDKSDDDYDGDWDDGRMGDLVPVGTVGSSMVGTVRNPTGGLVVSVRNPLNPSQMINVPAVVDQYGDLVPADGSGPSKSNEQLGQQSSAGSSSGLLLAGGAALLLVGLIVSRR